MTKDQKELLPLPRKSRSSLSGIQREDIAVANCGVDEEALDRDHLTAKCRKRGRYHVYDFKTRLTIVRFAK